MKRWLLLSPLVLAACTTTFDSSKVDYKSQSKQAPTLEIPPDLSVLTASSQALVPAGGATNASALQTQGATQKSTTNPVVAVNAVADVRVMREGGQRWLAVDRPPEKLWDEVKKFWADNGLAIAVDQPDLGIMETEWNENRAKLPQDGFRKYFGKILDGLYSTNERDKYRTRLEKTSNGGTEIYISHRGMAQDYADSSKSAMVWRPRPNDPELEIEFLKRLMVRLGGDQTVAAAALEQQPKANKPKTTSDSATDQAGALDLSTRVALEQNATQSSLILNEPFDQGWRRVGQALDRTNFTVEDRDRSKGTYFVRYVDADILKNQPGFFARLFGAKEKQSLQKYQIKVIADDQKTRVQVADSNGQLLNTEDAKKILVVLQADLK